LYDEKQNMMIRMYQDDHDKGFGGIGQTFRSSSWSSYAIMVIMF